MARRALRAAVWCAGLLGLVVALRLAATGDLSAPPITSPGDLGTWADDRGPVAAAVGLLRLGAELAVWYLIGLSLLELLVSRRGSRSAGVVRRLAPRATARLVRAGLGLGVVASAAVPPAGAVLASGPPGTAVMQPQPDDHGPGTARMVPQAAAAPAPAPPPASPPPPSHRVDAGDSFWTIAADVLEQGWGRRPTDAEIDPYWRTLVDANRHRLVSGDPDLVVPGQVFEVPSVPPPPT